MSYSSNTADLNDRFIRKYQAARGLKIDGIAGPLTQADLNSLLLNGTSPSSAVSSTDPLTWVDVNFVASIFPPTTPRSNITQYLPQIKTALIDRDLISTPLVLMALSTIRAETESFEPISEGVSKYNTSPVGTPGRHPFDLYDHRTDLGNLGPQDGERYRGRGFIQLTGRDNYRRIGEAIGVDLEAHPDLANRGDIAAAVLAEFLATRKERIEEALERGDLRLARRLVNGGSRGLERFKETYEAGERELRAS